MTQAVHVFARSRVQADKSGLAGDVMIEIRTNTLAQEEGCVSYNFLQSVDEPTLFTSSEVWSDAEAEAAHWQTGHLKASLAKMQGFLDGTPEITKFHRL